MAGYAILALFAVVGIWLVIHVRRTPRMPGRRPFDADEGNSLVDPDRKPTMSFNPPPGPGDGGG